MNHEADFRIDSSGDAEEINTNKIKPAGLPPNKLVVKVGEHSIPMTKGEGESVATTTDGRHFLIRPNEHRVYDVDSNVWHDIPQGTDPREFIDSL